MNKCVTLFLCGVLLFSASACVYTPAESGSAVSETPSDAVSENEISEESSVKPEEKNYKAYNPEYMKAIWLSQYDMADVYTSGSAQRSRTEFVRLSETIMDNILDYGFNTVIIQVRPFGDSFYPSELYPVSSFVSGKYGNEHIYDPFEILISLAHERGLSVHAWINPLRLMKTDEISSVPDGYAVKDWYTDRKTRNKYVVAVSSRYYLNPAYGEVRDLISDGAAEIAEKYDVDGIHMDDYFYPTTGEEFDSASYNSYKSAGGTLALADYRRQNIDLTVASIYRKVKSVSDDILFGISPAGNIKTTYSSLYADIYRWCEEDGYIDYICPQIYFGLEHASHDFVKTYGVWSDIIKNDVRLCVGITLGKALSGYDKYAGTGENEWKEHDDIIGRCLAFLSENDECSGVAVFCYQYFRDPVTGAEVSGTKAERDNARPVFNALG